MIEPEHTPAERDEWARETLWALDRRWDTLDRAGKVGTLHAILGAIDRERVERDQRLKDAVGDCPKEGCPCSYFWDEAEKLDASAPRDKLSPELDLED